jgi:ribosomal protein S18 acetylase RimI-like enzyme
MDPAPNSAYSIRSYRPEDRDACQVLYRAGLLGGKLAENDSGLDIDDIEASYLRPGSHFWVATAPDGDVVGMIGVQHHGDNVGEIRRLRVASNHRRRGIATKLLEVAIKFCHEHGYLKVKLDTFVDREPALRLFEKVGFRLSGTKSFGEKELSYFYLDLYQGEPKKK